MPAREFKNRADYVGVIVEAAERSLREDPTDDLYRCTTANVSGGHEYWGVTAIELYNKPETLEEALLVLELKTVLAHAIKNQVAILEKLINDDKVRMDTMGFPVDFGILMSTVMKLAQKDPLVGLHFKRYGERTAYKVSGLSLVEFLHRHCYRRGYPIERICSDI